MLPALLFTHRLEFGPGAPGLRATTRPLENRERRDTRRDLALLCPGEADVATATV